jgi:RNA polymerase sigma-70 factor, ECF subfamily
VDALTRHRSQQGAGRRRVSRRRHDSTRDQRHPNGQSTTTHIGTWLPEPVDIEADLAHSAERAEALDRAVLVLLENLSPIERAAYVLREAFDYPYRQISKVLAISEANARQLAARARLHLAGERRRQVSAAQHQRFLDGFVDAAQTGDLTTLEGLLAADVVTSVPGTIAA